MKKIVYLSILITLGFICYSQQLFSQGSNTVDLKTAKAVAIKYCLKTDNKYAHSVESDLNLSLVETKTAGKSVLCYIFNINTKDGFIIVSADINTAPILCYVPHGTYNKYLESRPPAFNEWLGAYTNQIEYSVKNAIKSKRSQDLWSTFASKGSLDAETMILKLTSKWNQIGPFNYYSPSGSNGKCPTGCVATAMGQIIYYYKWPVNGVGSHSYIDPDNPNVNSSCGEPDPSYGSLSFIDHTATYDYSAMEDAPSETNFEVSRLFYNCGVSVDMDFAYCPSWTNTYQVENALRDYFDYNTSIDYIIRSNYTEEAWESTLIDQIRNERPIQYRGQASEGSTGHSWVCFGYQAVEGANLFMFNWGFGGYYDGFFSLTTLLQYPYDGFSYINGAVINIFPTSQPNLSVQSASVIQNPISIGVPFTLNLNIKNTGSIDANASTAACYLSNDAILDKDDTFLGAINIPSLSSGHSVDMSESETIYSGTAGTYYIIVEADTEHDVHESAENDNTFPFTISLISSPVYEYQTAKSGNWTDLSTWQYLDGSVWKDAISCPNSASGKITIRSGHTVTVSENLNVDEITIMSGGQVTVSPGITVIIHNGSDDIDFSVNGKIVNSGTITSSGKLAFNSGSIYEHAQDGGTIPVATWDVASDCNITGITDLQPDIPSSTQPFGNFTYNCPGQSAELISLYGKLTSIAGNFTVVSTGPAGNDLRLGRTSTGNLTVNGNFVQTGGWFLIEGEGYNYSTRSMTVEKNFNVQQNGVFIISYSSGTGTLNVGGDYSNDGEFYFALNDNNLNTTLNVTGNCYITGGTLNMSGISWEHNITSIGTLNVAGNFSHTNGIITENSSGSGNIVFDGSSTQIYTSGGSISGTINFKVNSGSTLQMGTAAAPSLISSGSSGTFTLLSGATLGITSPVGITSTGSAGNVQVTGTRTYNTGANYIYNGSGAQVSGSGLPSTVNSLSVGGASNLGLSTASPLIVTNDLSIGSGAKLNIVAGQQVSTGNFTNDGNMIIESSAVNNNGSFIATGTLTQTGTVTYKRQLRAKASNGDYHLISSPVSNMTIPDFTTLNSAKVSKIKEWDETNATWPNLTGSSGNLVSGQGYSLTQAVDGGANDNKFSFTGVVVKSASVTATSPYSTDCVSGTLEEYNSRWIDHPSRVNYGAGGWNLLGNPFTSAMNAETFVTDNLYSFDPSYKAIYVYDHSGSTGIYKYVAASVPIFPTGIGSFGSSTIQAGQGFFVLAMKNDVAFTFNSGIRTHASAVTMAKSGGTEDAVSKSDNSASQWYGLQLKAKKDSTETITTIVYNDKMTAGLDPGYDVGLYNSGSAVEIYTSLAEKDNGVNFTRQALPVTGCGGIIVSVGINSAKGGEVTFSATVIPIDNYKFYLEDRSTGIFTNLNTGSYKATVPAKTYGTGRFFLYTSINNPKGKGTPEESPGNMNLKIWRSRGDIVIEGAVSSKATAEVYNLHGSKIFETKLVEGTYNSFPVPAAIKGVYIVRVTDGAKLVIKKVVVL